METQEKEVEYYETEDGKNPFREWFNSLRDMTARNKIDARIRRAEFGNMGHCEPVGEGVMELKIDFGLFGQVGNKLVVLLNGGDKNSQSKNIKIAHEYWADYRRRYG